LLTGVLNEGATIAGSGIVLGIVGGLVLTRAAGSFLGEVSMPGLWSTIAAAAALALAAVAASLIPAARAAKVDVARALRSE
jgi:ABC-type antimicrobial peptide transport system permease subunit